MMFYPKVTKTRVIHLDELSQQISYNSTVAQDDCYAVIIGLVDAVALSLEEEKIVRLGHLGSFQISVKVTGSSTAIEVSPENIKSVSIVFRPGKKFKTMLSPLLFIRKK